MYTENFTVMSASFDVQTAADKATLSMPFNKQKVKKAWIEVRGTDAGGATVKFDKRPTAGSDTGRGDGDIAVITIPASNQQGKRLYEIPATVIHLVAGEEVVAEVTAEGVAALQVVAGLEVERVAETEANSANMVAA